MRHKSFFSVICFDVLIALVVTLFFAFIAFAIVSLFGATSFEEFSRQLASRSVYSAIWISLKTSLLVVLLSLVIGYPVAYFLALSESRFKVVLETMIDLPIVMPPLVSGLALLIMLGRTGSIGGILHRLGIDVIFSLKGVIIAQFFVSAPFFIKAVKESIKTIPKRFLLASASLGRSPVYTAARLIFPLSRQGIITGLVMTWARALGEFGATSMVAGCIPQQTETITVSIYMQSMGGDLPAALALSLVLVFFSFVVLLLLKFHLGESYAVAN